MTDMAATSTARRSAAEYARAGTHQLGSLGIGAFILLGLGSLGLYLRLQATAVGGNRWSAVPLAPGLLLYIPQFSGPQTLRIAHGTLMLIGCCWLAWSLAAAAPRRQ